jgi:hypothetical protein
LEELKAGLVQVDRHRKVVRGTTTPKTLTDVMGSGSDLYKAADMTEMAVLTGMPAEHQKRTVVIQPRMHKTLQSGAYISSLISPCFAQLVALSFPLTPKASH